jgi:hypothetical protein
MDSLSTKKTATGRIIFGIRDKGIVYVVVAEYLAPNV